MNNPFHPYPMPKLTCELVPKGQWNNNLRKMLPKSQWDALRSACYKHAGMTCECCGDLKGKPPEAHEIWFYDDHRRIQRLGGLVSLCYMCHRCKHMGHTRSLGQEVFTRALNHLAVVNKWPVELAIEYVGREFQIHTLRSELTWNIDVRWLDKSDEYIKSAEVAQRDAKGKLAQRTLDAMRTRDADE